MGYIVDSNIWIEFFNRRNYFDSVSGLLNDNKAYINGIILAELIPSSRAKRNQMTGSPVRFFPEFSISLRKTA